MLFNSEAWYNVTSAEMDLLETVDLMLLRGILKAPKSTPKEMLFLELGLVPFREIVRKRRLGFLFYILHQSKDSMIFRVFESQVRNKTSKDWVTTVLSDLKELSLNLTFEDIKQMKKSLYMNMIKRKVDHKALNELDRKKQSHTKVKDLKHPVLKMQKYLAPNGNNIKQDDCQLIFKLRCRVTDTKMNMKGIYDTYECEACGKESESQEHILQCNVILQMNKEYDKMKIPEYEKLLDGNVDEQLILSKIFSSNMKIMEKLKSKK